MRGNRCNASPLYGLELPEAVVGLLALARGGLVGARWIEPEDYHIAL